MDGVPISEVESKRRAAGLVGQRLQPVLAARQSVDVKAARGEGTHGRGPYAAGGTGHQG
jgi:hypothetical protein